jgi:nucleoside-diphosphate-sugar epimerase
MANDRVLVTGGSGFLGQYLATYLQKQGKEVVIFDLLDPERQSSSFIKADIRDLDSCIEATRNVRAVYHNVAQVPLAKNKDLFRSVNIDGTKNILEASAINKVENFVYTSSSAVYGLPNIMPANNSDNLLPIEEYGRTKLQGEQIVDSYRDRLNNTSIVRPRTILGSGRLGLFSILFDWISEGLDVFVFDDGDKPYQFIHASDLVKGIAASGDVFGHTTFNLGALQFNSLRDDLEALCVHAGTGSRVRSIPSFLVKKPLLIGSKFNLIPFASYQLLLYSQAMYFDSSKDWKSLGVTPEHTNSSALIESYEWFLRHRENLQESGSQSVHKSLAKGKSLELIKVLLRVI